MDLNAILKQNFKVRLNILCFLTMYGALFAAQMLCVYSRGWVFSLFLHLVRRGELFAFFLARFARGRIYSANQTSSVGVDCSFLKGSLQHLIAGASCGPRGAVFQFRIWCMLCAGALRARPDQCGFLMSIVALGTVHQFISREGSPIRLSALNNRGSWMVATW